MLLLLLELLELLLVLRGQERVDRRHAAVVHRLRRGDGVEVAGGRRVRTDMLLHTHRAG